MRTFIPFIACISIPFMTVKDQCTLCIKLHENCTGLCSFSAVQREDYYVMHAEGAYEAMPECVEERMLWPRHFFAAAARVFEDTDLIHGSETALKAARLRTLKQIIQPSVHEQLSLVYGGNVVGVAGPVAELLCKHSADLNSLLALKTTAKCELPAVVTATIEHFRISQPVVISSIHM